MRHNLRRGIHRGESSPRPAGWGTQPLRIQPSVCDPAHLSILSLLIQTNRTCRPAGALGYLVYCVFYKHVAPLGLNAAQFAARYPSWGEFSSPSGLGNPTPTDPTSLAHVPIFVPPGSPVAPLGLNAAQFAARYPSWGEVSSPSGLGNPTPTDPTSRCSRSNFRASRFTCRPSGALGYLVYCVCYKHVAPLGLMHPCLISRLALTGTHVSSC